MDPNERVPSEPKSSPPRWPDAAPGDQRPAPPPQPDFMRQGFAVTIVLLAVVTLVVLLAVNVAVGVLLALVAVAVGVLWRTGIVRAAHPELASARTRRFAGDLDVPREVIALGLGVVAVAVALFVLSPAAGLTFVVLGVIALFSAHASGILHRRQIIDRWDELLVAGRGHAPMVLEQTIATLTAMEIPDIAWRLERIAPSWARAVSGDTRPFLVVTHTRNRRLKPYKIYLTIRDYGTSLQTSWFLAYQLGFRRQALALAGLSGLGLDPFDEQDLSAYVTAVHRALVGAVVKLMATLGQDASSLNRNSKGFLGVS